jgi:hypothetical protein
VCTYTFGRDSQIGHTSLVCVLNQHYSVCLLNQHYILTLVPVCCACTFRGLISFVIVMLNFVLKSILQWLVEWEKHWTQSDKVCMTARASRSAQHGVCVQTGMRHQRIGSTIEVEAQQVLPQHSRFGLQRLVSTALLLLGRQTV